MPRPTPPPRRASSARCRSRAPRPPRRAPTSRGPRTAASSRRRPVSAPVADEDEVLQADRFLDREISWLQFNERVLQLAADENVPLLERARYLAIFASNLDEFFMVRVAGLKRRIATGIAVRSASGLEPREVLEQISLVAHELLSMQARVYGTQVRPALEAEGITIVRWDELSEDERDRLGAHVHRPRSSRCSRRWPSTRPTRSPTSPGSRSTSPSCWSTRAPARSTSPGSRCRRCSPASCASSPARTSRRWPTCTTPGSCRSRTSSRPTSTTSSRAWRCASTSPSGSPATRTSRSRRTTPRTSSPRSSAS